MWPRPPLVCLDRAANNEGSHQEYKTADDATGQHPQFACRTSVATVWPSEGVDSPRSGATPHQRASYQVAAGSITPVREHYTS